MAKNWAIAVGINQYDNLKSLKYAESDAEAMKAWCEREGSFDRTFLFTADSPDIPATPSPISTQPTYGCLRRFLRAQFERPLLETGDNLWFFFAGHGKRYQDKDYLLLADSDPGDVAGSALSVAWVTERLRRCGADNVVLFLDACREEGSRGEVGIGLDEPQGVITFYGCNPQQQSYEIEELQHGAFTYALLEALAIRGTDNCATVERLDQRLRYRVPQITAYYEKPRQSPYAIAEPAPKYHLILLTQQATVRDAEVLKLKAMREERQGNYDFAEQLWIRVLAVSPADPDAIEAIRHLDRIQTGREPIRRSIGRNGGESRSSFPLEFPRLSLPSVRISRRKLLQLVGWTGAGIGTAVIGKIAYEIVPKLKIQPFSSLTPAPKLSKFAFETLTVNGKGEEISRSSHQAEYFTEDLGNEVKLEMVAIPGGTFTMGAPATENGSTDDERPQHQVTVPEFYMSKFQITQQLWKAVASFPKIEHDLNPDSSYFKGDNRPVEKVSWYDAVEFCKRLSKKTGREYRLPSEAEWEYACRAGTTTPFYFGETITGELANYNASETYADEPKGEYREKTTPVGIFPPNAFGLYDMHGNVWEWCADTWHNNYNGAPTDGSAWLEGGNKDLSPLRGGSWAFDPENCRSASRYINIRRVDRFNQSGFRVVCGFGRIL